MTIRVHPMLHKICEICAICVKKKTAELFGGSKIYAKDAVFQRLASIAEVAALSKEERREYDESLRKFRDTISVMEGQFLEGEEKGRAEAKAEAEAKARQEKLESARKMKAKGFSDDDIVEIIGITPEELKAL